jgi:hypothetical protein
MSDLLSRVMNMNESNSGEVEKVLLFVSDAKERASKARSRLESEGADQHVLDALARAEADLASAHRELMKGTYFAVPARNERLAI